MTTNNSKLFTNIFSCNICNYVSNRKCDYNKHLLSKKHIKNEILQNTTKNSKEFLNKIYTCKCGKIYKHHSSLYNHRKNCDFKECQEYNDKIMENKDSSELKTMLLQVMKENKDLQKTILNLVPQIGNNINTTNNVKNKFNINVFLNEKCKDAISMDKFIESIEVSMNNLLTTKDKGLGEGLSSIIIDNMNKLSLYERPMHCTDKKRETMYIKNNEWLKDEKHEHVSKLLNCVENKQMKNIKIWMDEHPTFMENEKLQEEYINIVKNSTSSINECKGKAIKNVCEKVFLDKISG